MFSRNFMKVYPIRKYGNPSAGGGNVCTDHYILGKRDIYPYRIGVFFAVSLITIMASNNFGLFYEIVTHAPPPYVHDFIDSSVPASVRQPNEEIIANYQTISEMKKWMKNFQ